MGETISTSNKCQTANLLNPVIAQESSVGIEEAKGKELLQGKMEEKLPKRNFSQVTERLV